MKINNRSSKIPLCYLCHGKRFETLFVIDKYNINRCIKCGFVYTTPIPSKLLMNEYYSRFDKNIINKKEIISKDSDRILNALQKYRKKKMTLLDIGCGNGILLEKAEIYGFIPFGLDISSKFKNYIKRILKLPFIHADIQVYKSKNKYDFITLNQVIEHFSNPQVVIQNCYNLLNKGGFLSIATPNIESFTAEIRKDEFDYLIPPEHLSYFSHSSLQSILNKNGFKIVESFAWSYSFDVAGIIKYMFKRREVNKTPVVRVTFNKSIRSRIKFIKHILFDKIICPIICFILNSFSTKGTMIHLIAQKV